jgi:hypothetical protein
MTSLQQSKDKPVAATILMPAPTGWPFVFALGVALIFAGLLTSTTISALGAVLYLAGAVGWFRQVLPQERREEIPVVLEAEPAVTAAHEVTRLWAAASVPRAWLPLKIYPVSAGVKGGLAGAVAMALLALLYGIISHGSIWYPINLLAGSLSAPSATASVEQMIHFRLGWFLFALALHLAISLLVGLLYGAMLPMLPTRPILLGGVIAPLIWTGLLYHTIDYVNPLMDERINWWWFAVSQFAFGIVAGLVVIRQNKVWTSENLPFALRAGIEAPGVMHERDREDERQ